MCDEKLVTMTRPGASRMMRLSAAATSCSDCVMPGPLRVGGVGQHEIDAVGAEARELREVGRGAPWIGVWSIL